ncbi:MAG: transposase [Candidatus Competibacteraceae bacterium]|nr:transposase [Candidatus Competibacteraceae bacterium]
MINQVVGSASISFSRTKLVKNIFNQLVSFCTASKGLKRHIVVDTTGYPIVMVVHAANIDEGHAAKEVLSVLFSIVNTVRKIWADGGYKGEAFIDGCKKKFNGVIKVVKQKKKKEKKKKKKKKKGFTVRQFTMMRPPCSMRDQDVRDYSPAAEPATLFSS